MLHQVYEINLPYEELGLKTPDKPATITTYIKDIFPNDQDPFNRPLIVICPGGGYNHYSPREGEAIAVKMLEMGFNAVVFRYSLMPYVYPTQVYEAAYTMKFVRDHAAEWDVNPDNIIIAGFSAGGHVAACLGTMWNTDLVKSFANNNLGCDCEYVKPNGMLLGYPVITSGEFAHRASFVRMLGDNYEKYLKDVSLEERVSKDTPECFIWHTFEDNSVPLENSLLFVQALRKNNIPFEYHVFPKGCHGLGLGTKETTTKGMNHYQPEVFAWTELFAKWMER
ncbi:MAG: alpha/beta hydrolase [Eubacteriales bacterium]|nr:alpha/beta hydrolase [Eubacteriales bacterium]